MVFYTFASVMLFSDTYKTIKNRAQGTFRDRASKFIAVAIPVITEDEVKESLIALKKEYYDATHHCYAYQLGFDKSAYRINDDGEPSGTAGRPIFGQIQSKDLTNILIVVIRYYGGTKLGVSGLINAYKTAAKEALDTAEIIEKTIKDVYEISFAYDKMNDVMKVLKDEDAEQLYHHFELDCKIVFSVRKSDSDKIYDIFSKMKDVSLKYIRTE